MDKYADIIEKIKKQETIDPPVSFTDGVLRRLPNRYPGFLLAAGSFLYLFYNQTLASDGDQAKGLTSRECSFYFFITGLFYLIIGIILTIGLQGISSGMDAMGWIKLQPQLNIGVALWLLALGVILIMGGSVGVKAARYGALVYICFTVVNFILMRHYVQIPFASLFMIGFAATNVFMGFMLTQAVNKVEVKTV